MMRSNFLALIACVAAFGQNAGPAFEVASIKPTPPSSDGRVMFLAAKGGPGTSDPNRISWSHARMISVLAEAFDVKTYQISGPDWIDMELFDFEIGLPEGTTKEQSLKMWQTLLAERFGLSIHREARDFQVRELVQAKGGAKLKNHVEGPSAPPDGPPQMLNSGKLDRPAMAMMIRPGQSGAPTAHMAANGQTMDRLAHLLSDQLHLPVIDKTGLTGKYDFELDFTPNLAGMPLPPGLGPAGPGAAAAPPAASDPGTNLGSALQEIGLRLNPSKGKLDVIVIDKLSRTPTEN